MSLSEGFSARPLSVIPLPAKKSATGIDGLLERVTYIIERAGSEVNVETKLSHWRDENGQKVARRIERLENGQSMFVMNIRSAQFGRRADDGMFQQ